MKTVIMTLAAAFAVSAYADNHAKPAPTAPAAPAHGKPTATAPATTHGDDACKAVTEAKAHKKCMDEQKKKSM